MFARPFQSRKGNKMQAVMNIMWRKKQGDWSTKTGDWQDWLKRIRSNRPFKFDFLKR